MRAALSLFVLISVVLCHALPAAASSPACPENKAKGNQPMMAGGFTNQKPADATIKGVLKGTKGWESKVVQQLQSSGENIAQLPKYKICSYATQVVAGINYDVTVALANGKLATIKIFKPLPYTKQPNQLQGVHLR